MTKDWTILGVAGVIALFLFGSILYFSDWTAIRPWLATPLRDATVGDALVMLIIYLTLRK